MVFKAFVVEFIETDDVDKFGTSKRNSEFPLTLIADFDIGISFSVNLIISNLSIQLNQSEIPHTEWHLEFDCGSWWINFPTCV